MTRILLYSKEPILGSGLAAVLAEARGYDVLYVCSSLDNLFEELVAGERDLAVIDYTDEITQDVLRAIGAYAKVKAVLWARKILPEMAFQAFQAGIRGVVAPSLPPSVLVGILEDILRGDLAYSKELTDAFFSRRQVQVTARERALIGLLAQGLRNKEIGAEMGITEGTVKVYVSRLFEKMGMKDRLELAIYGLRNIGFVEPGSPVVSAARTMLVGAPPAPVPPPQRFHVTGVVRPRCS